jgi:hypothetical protein
MARIRSIHPAACTSEKLARVSGDAERCYWRLQTHCDDAGRCEDHPRLIWAALFPLHADVTPEHVDGWLSELDAEGLLSRYQVDGKRYLEIVDFGTYQKPKYPSISRIPPQPSPSPPPALGEPSPEPLHGEVVGVELEVESIAPAPPPPEAALHAIDDLAFAVYAVCRIDPAAITRSALGSYRRAIADLRAVDATPDEVKARAKVYRARWPSASLTPPALAKQWAACDASAVRNPAQPNDWVSDGMTQGSPSCRPKEAQA